MKGDNSVIELLGTGCASGTGHGVCTAVFTPPFGLEVSVQ